MDTLQRREAIQRQIRKNEDPAPPRPLAGTPEGGWRVNADGSRMRYQVVREHREDGTQLPPARVEAQRAAAAKPAVGANQRVLPERSATPQTGVEEGVWHVDAQGRRWRYRTNVIKTNSGHSDGGPKAAMRPSGALSPTSAPTGGTPHYRGLREAAAANIVSSPTKAAPTPAAANRAAQPTPILSSAPASTPAPAPASAPTPAPKAASPASPKGRPHPLNPGITVNPAPSQGSPGPAIPRGMSRAMSMASDFSDVHPVDVGALADDFFHDTVEIEDNGWRTNAQGKRYRVNARTGKPRSNSPVMGLRVNAPPVNVPHRSSFTSSTGNPATTTPPPPLITSAAAARPAPQQIQQMRGGYGGMMGVTQTNPNAYAAQMPQQQVGVYTPLGNMGWNGNIQMGQMGGGMTIGGLGQMGGYTTGGWGATQGFQGYGNPYAGAYF